MRNEGMHEDLQSILGQRRGEGPCYCRPVAAAPPTEKYSAFCAALLRRRVSRLLVLPAAPAPLGLRYVTPNPYSEPLLAEPHQHLVAVIALVGHHLFDPHTSGSTASTCSAAMTSVSGSVAVSPSDASCTVTDTMARACPCRPRARPCGSRCVRPSFIFAIFASGVLRRVPLVVRHLLVLPRPVEPSQIRPRRRFHTRRFRQPPSSDPETARSHPTRRVPSRVSQKWPGPARVGAKAAEKRQVSANRDVVVCSCGWEVTRCLCPLFRAVKRPR